MNESAVACPSRIDFATGGEPLDEIARNICNLVSNSAGSCAAYLNSPATFCSYSFTCDCPAPATLAGGNRLSITADIIPPCFDPGTSSCHYLKFTRRKLSPKGYDRVPDSICSEPPNHFPPRLIRPKRQ